jgi:cell division septation protein DedD
MSMLFQEVESVEQELHFSPGIILSIFMGITLVSAVFFGLGYSFGRTGDSAGNFGHAQHSMPTIEHPAPAVAISNPPAQKLLPKPSAAVALQPATLQPAAIATNAQPAPASASAVTPTTTSSKREGNSASNFGYMIQIAALASRHDAQALTVALRKDGLRAQLRNGRHDRFFHVQLGPFATQKQADAMRHKVIAAGYRAILKPVQR